MTVSTAIVTQDVAGSSITFTGPSGFGDVEAAIFFVTNDADDTDLVATLIGLSHSIGLCARTGASTASQFFVTVLISESGPIAQRVQGTDHVGLVFNPQLVVEDISLTFNNWETDGVSVTVSPGGGADAAYKITAILFGGTTVEANVGLLDVSTPSVAVTTDSVDSPSGFKPDTLFCVSTRSNTDSTLSTHAALSVGMASRNTATDAVDAQFSYDVQIINGGNRQNYAHFHSNTVVRNNNKTALFGGAQITSFTATGFTAAQVAGSGPGPVGYLALFVDGLSFSLQQVPIPSTPSTRQVTLGFTPQLALMLPSRLGLSRLDASSALAGTDSSQYGIGVTDLTTERAIGSRSQHQSTSDASCQASQEFMYMDNNFGNPEFHAQTPARPFLSDHDIQWVLAPAGAENRLSIYWALQIDSGSSAVDATIPYLNPTIAQDPVAPTSVLANQNATIPFLDPTIAQDPVAPTSVLADTTAVMVFLDPAPAQNPIAPLSVLADQVATIVFLNPPLGQNPIPPVAVSTETVATMAFLNPTPAQNPVDPDSVLNDQVATIPFLDPTIAQDPVDPASVLVDQAATIPFLDPTIAQDPVAPDSVVVSTVAVMVFLDPPIAQNPVAPLSVLAQPEAAMQFLDPAPAQNPVSPSSVVVGTPPTGGVQDRIDKTTKVILTKVIRLP